MAERTVLIVGGAGYFGSRLAEAFAETHSVSVTYRSMGPLRSAWVGQANIRALAFDSMHVGALDTCRDFDLVVNLAMPSAVEAQSDPEGARSRGLAVARVCAGLLEAGRVGRLVHASTFHVYNEGNAPDYMETTSPSPQHPYGVAHVAVEQFLADHPKAYDVQIMRPTNLVGAPAHKDLGAQAGLFFLDLCRQAAKTGRMVLRNDGQSYRDILPFEDAIAAVRMLAEVVEPQHLVYNLAAGRAVTLGKIAEAIAAAVGEIEIFYGDGEDQFRRPFNVDVTRLRALGWAPKSDFGREAMATVATFR